MPIMRTRLDFPSDTEGHRAWDAGRRQAQQDGPGTRSDNPYSYRDGAGVTRFASFKDRCLAASWGRGYSHAVQERLQATYSDLPA